jgi:polyhydroxyalkanoate synthesis regulator protein
MRLAESSAFSKSEVESGGASSEIGNCFVAGITVNNKGIAMTPLRALPEQVLFQVAVMRELMKTIELAPVQDVVAAIEKMSEQIDQLEKAAKGIA